MRPDRIMILLFCTILVLFALLCLLIPQNSFSQTEKRALQPIPKFGFSKLLSGKFTMEVNDWYADQFPLREGFVALKALSCVLTGQAQNNGVLLGAGDQLARWEAGDGSVTDRIDETHLHAACAGLRRAAENTDCQTIFLLPARNLDVARSAFDYPTTSGDRLHAILTEELSGSPWVDVEPLLCAKYEAGEDVVFRTDHHWTALGAYYAYCEVLKRFGMEDDILPRKAFREEMITGAFGGTYWARGGMPWVQKESLTVWYGRDDDSYTVTADGKPLNGFYTIPQSDPGYEVFLDGTHDFVTVEKEGETRPNLVIFKDSFANALAPFLARHFNLVLLNLSSQKRDFTNVSRIAKEYQADAVLVVYSAFNLLSTDTAAKLQ